LYWGDSAVGNANLSAAGIELGATFTNRVMEGDDLMANQVVPRSDGFRDLDVEALALDCLNTELE